MEARPRSRDPLDDAALPVGGALTGRGFWIAYAIGWALLAGLAFFAGLAEEESARAALIATFVVLAPPAVAGVGLGAHRRRLFRPERPPLRALALLAGVGAAYAVVSALVSWALLAGAALVIPEARAWLAAPMTPRVVTYVFVYMLIAGLLVWSESLVRIQESRAEAARQAMLRAQAEARAVRASFNPHFVFNTLHSLMLLVRAEPDTAERAIEDVAALIRYASRLQREERDIVPLSDEIDFARRYLALEELRLEDRCRVRWDVAPGLDGAGVPAFSLQTLLENAVRHGVEPRPGGATVRVRAAREGAEVVLRVEDDGPGADPASVEAQRGRGLGLLRDRVRGLHGDAGHLAWETERGGGFRVELRVPATDAP